MPNDKFTLITLELSTDKIKTREICIVQSNLN